MEGQDKKSNEMMERNAESNVHADSLKFLFTARTTHGALNLLESNGETHSKL